MAVDTFFNNKHLKLVDMFFFLDEEDILRVYILKDVPFMGSSENEILCKGEILLEYGFGAYEWLVNFSKQLSVYINKEHYRNISDRQPTFNETLQKEKCRTCEYKFDLLITDMSAEYSKVEIITDMTVGAVNYDDAISKVCEWIESAYSKFEELEWFIKDKGKMLIYNIYVPDFLDEK